MAHAVATHFDEPALYTQLESQLKRFKGDQEEALQILEKLYNGTGELDQKRFKLSVEKQLDKILEKLRCWQAEFNLTINSLDKCRRWPESMDLTHDIFT